MNLYALCVLCFGVASLLIGLLVWIKLESKIGFYYFLFSAFAGFWGIFEGQQFSNNFSRGESIFFAQCSNSAAIFIGPFWYHFTLAFQRKKYEKYQQRLLLGFYSLAVFIFIFSFSNLFVAEVREIVGIKYYTSPGPVWHVFTALFFTSVPLGFVELFRYLKKLSGKERKQCLWLICTTGVGFLGGGLTFPPVYGIPFPQYGLFIMPLYPLFMAISMMKFGLLTEENLIMAAHKDKLAALGILTASINHEIRSPLFVIRGTIESAVTGEVKERVLSQIDRLTDIVSRLTHFAKKGVDETAKIESLDLKTVLTDIRPLFQYHLNYQKIEFTSEIPNNLPPLLADRRYLEEIIFNLLINACQAVRETKNPVIKLSATSLRPVVSKAEPKQGTKIPDPSVSRQSLVVSPSTITIVIEDNGPGIPPSQIKHIFKPFHTTKSEGTGLGLYITKQLVEKCGGKIEVQSKVEEGAKFIVRLKAV